jgi:phospholipid transport system substrate-binding protein
MKINFKSFCFLLFSGFLLAHSPLLFANSDNSAAPIQQTDDPQVMLQTLTETTLTILKTNHDTFKADPNKMVQMINQVLLPHVDQVRMAQSVVGRAIWMQASDADQTDFTQAFMRLLVHTYAGALNAYTNQQVEYYPIRGGIQHQTEIEIQSQILPEDGPPIAINYRLNLNNGEWKINDVIVEGVSLLQSFRAQFQNFFKRDGHTLTDLTVTLNQRSLESL